jgi:NADH-quinone oxidoreductase subunit C
MSFGGEMTEQKGKLLNVLNMRFRTIRQRKAHGNIVSLEIDQRELIPVMYYLRHHTGFTLLQLISCVDWDEENVFQMTYLIWNQIEKIQLLLTFRIAKDTTIQIPSVIPIWPHAETFERELREMFGVQFDGNPRQDESFLLEDWNGPPPMLRKFDTRAFSNERFGERPGRHSEDTRRYVGRKVGEYDLSRSISGE